MLAHMCHGVKLLLADLAGEFLLCVTMHDLVVLMQGPELLEGFAAGHTLREKEEGFGCGLGLAATSTGPQFPHPKSAGEMAGPDV